MSLIFITCLVGAAVAVPIHVGHKVGQPPPYTTTRRVYTTPGPATGPTFWDVIGNNSDYSTFHSMVMSNKDIFSQYVGDKYPRYFTTRNSYQTGQTFLIPNNKAFAALGDYKAIAADTAEFQRIINFHTFFSVGQGGSISSRELAAGKVFKTASNNELLKVLVGTVTTPSGFTKNWQFTPEGQADKGMKNVIANVVKADIKAAEGLMHEIDAVLIPPHPAAV